MGGVELDVYKSFRLTPGSLEWPGEGLRLRVGAHLENPFNTPYLYLQGGGDSPGFREIRTLTVNTPGADKGFYTGARCIRFQARLQF